jgi:hypothetical protein
VVLKNININNVFLSYVMKYKYIQDQIKEKVVGGVVPTLSTIFQELSALVSHAWI